MPAKGQPPMYFDIREMQGSAETDTLPFTVHSIRTGAFPSPRRHESLDPIRHHSRWLAHQILPLLIPGARIVSLEYSLRAFVVDFRRGLADIASFGKVRLQLDARRRQAEVAGSTRPPDLLTGTGEWLVFSGADSKLWTHDDVIFQCDDPWGNPCLIEASSRGVCALSLGSDGEVGTNDDIRWPNLDLEPRTPKRDPWWKLR